MEMKQCAKGGHFYDASIHSECPYCTGAATGGFAPADGATRPPMGGFDRTCPPGGPANDCRDDERTRAPVLDKLGIDPVVGWLVCVDGPSRGRDYRIHSDNNFIGSDRKNDICIPDDKTISHVNHAIISYDTKENAYYFAHSEGRAITRLNGKAILTTTQLKAYDELEIGQTKLLFIPFCGELFRWE